MSSFSFDENNVIRRLEMLLGKTRPMTWVLSFGLLLATHGLTLKKRSLLGGVVHRYWPMSQGRVTKLKTLCKESKSMIVCRDFVVPGGIDKYGRSPTFPVLLYGRDAYKMFKYNLLILLPSWIDTVSVCLQHGIIIYLDYSMSEEYDRSRCYRITCGIDVYSN